jgi:hypothetical protein
MARLFSTFFLFDEKRKPLKSRFTRRYRGCTEPFRLSQPSWRFDQERCLSACSHIITSQSMHCRKRRSHSANTVGSYLHQNFNDGSLESNVVVERLFLETVLQVAE